MTKKLPEYIEYANLIGMNVVGAAHSSGLTIYVTRTGNTWDLADTDDYDPNRLRVEVDSKNKITKILGIG